MMMTSYDLDDGPTCCKDVIHDDLHLHYSD